MGRNNTGPIIRMSSSGTHSAGGIGCCFCRCCTCIHVEFLKTLPGIVKVCETVSEVISRIYRSIFMKFKRQEYKEKEMLHDSDPIYSYKSLSNYYT